MPRFQDEPPTHLTNVVAGEIEAPLYLDEDEQRSINGRIDRHSVVSRHSASQPTPVRVRPRATPAPAPLPPPPPPPPPAMAPPPQMPGVDPLLIATPPELAPTIFGWVRRLALQLDLKSADRMLRDALLDVTSSLSVAIVYPGAEELYSLGADEEVPPDPTPLVMVAQARRAMIASHTAILPIVTSGETVGVILLRRNPRNPGYTPIEQVSMLCLSREAAAILHNLATEHVQKQVEVKADAGSLYRGEALEAHRSRGQEGHALALSPGWGRRTYPILIIGLVVALIFAIFIHVPTYSTGRGIIVYPGERVTSPGGIVDRVFVAPTMKVKKGQPLFAIQAREEEAALDTKRKEADAAAWIYLQDPNDAGAARQLYAATFAYEQGKKVLDQKTIRAKTEGVIADVHLKSGSATQPGELAVQITPENALPELWAIMPGNDRPRIRNGQELQIHLPGFNKNRERTEVVEIKNENFSGQEVVKFIGSEFADTLRMEGSFALVRARLTSRTFVAGKQTLYFVHGTVVETEIKVASKPFLVTLLPALEKYLPD